MQETVVTGDNQSDNRSRIEYYRNLIPTSCEEMILKTAFEILEGVYKAANEKYKTVPLLTKMKLIREDMQMNIDFLLQRITNDLIRKKAATELKAFFDSDDLVSINITPSNSIPGRMYKS